MGKGDAAAQHEHAAGALTVNALAADRVRRQPHYPDPDRGGAGSHPAKQIGDPLGVTSGRLQRRLRPVADREQHR